MAPSKLHARAPLAGFFLRCALEAEVGSLAVGFGLDSVFERGGVGSVCCCGLGMRVRCLFCVSVCWGVAVAAGGGGEEMK